MLIRAVTYPIRVTFHVMFAMANYWLEVPERIDLLAWPDDDPDPSSAAS